MTNNQNNFEKSFASKIGLNSIIKMYLNNRAREGGRAGGGDGDELLGKENKKY